MERQKYRQMEMLIDRQMVRLADEKADKQTAKWTRARERQSQDKEIDRLTERRVYGQKDRWTDKRTDGDTSRTTG
jgi:hypothetical protein